MFASAVRSDVYKRQAEYAMCNPVDMMFAPNNLLDLSGEKLLERIQYLQSIAERFLMEEGEKFSYPLR